MEIYSKWKMIYNEKNLFNRKFKSGFMTSNEIKLIYGIEKIDLPKGSKIKNKKKINKIINEFNKKNILLPTNWKKLPKIQSQQRKNKKKVYIKKKIL